MSRHQLLRSLISYATRTGASSEPVRTATEVLEAFNDAALGGSGIIGGSVLISTTEAGGSATFSIPSGWGPLQAAILFQDAIDMIAGKRTIRRLRADFSKARL